MAAIQINASWANGKTLGEFAKVLQQRMKYMRETARDSVAACAINVLKGIRTITKVAKPSKVKVNLKPESNLYLSFTTQSGRKHPCLRLKGSNQHYVGNERFVVASNPTNTNGWQVYRFTDTLSKNLTTYLIAAPSAAQAKAKVRQMLQSRIMRFAGLARRAISFLMMKTSTKNINDSVPMRVSQKANAVTHQREIVAKSNDGNGGKYALVLVDDLHYALDAIKGGQAAVDLQMKKSMNKIVSIINQKLKKGNGLLGTTRLETPFPEVRTHRK